MPSFRSRVLVAVSVIVLGACSGSGTTGSPSAAPTATPTVAPTATGTVAATVIPTSVPTASPTAAPTAPPTASPVATPAPTPTRTPKPTSAVALENLIAPGAKIETIATDLEFAEGPLWLSDGRLIVSEVDGAAVVVFDAAGKKDDLRRPSNHANGHALGADGLVLQAEHGDAKTPGRITRLAASGPDAVLADNFQGKRFNSPNDLVVKSDGTIWFTDPDFDLTGSSATGFRGVYRLDPDTRTVTLVTKALSEPNGIAFSPDEKTLYVSDTNRGNGTVMAFPVNADDTVGPGKPFARGCDGIGVDEQGNVWATLCGPAIIVTDPNGIEVGSIDIGGSATNLAWGGEDGKTLFVTTQERGVFRLLLTVREAQ